MLHPPTRLPCQITLPPFVHAGVTAAATRTLTDAVSGAVAATLVDVLIHPPEAAACCGRCRVSADEVACQCCAGYSAAGQPAAAAERAQLDANLRAYAAHYVPVALADWAKAGGGKS